MNKKLYIEPKIKILSQRLELMLYDGTEDTSDPGDWGGAKEYRGGFEEEETGAWGQIDWD